MLQHAKSVCQKFEKRAKYGKKNTWIWCQIASLKMFDMFAINVQAWKIKFGDFPNFQNFLPLPQNKPPAPFSKNLKKKISESGTYQLARVAQG